MGRRRAGPLVALLVAGWVVAGPLPGDPAVASCAGPTLYVGDAERPLLRAGESLEVGGRFFVDGCNDVGGQDAFGCSTSEPEPEVPMTDVELRLRQDGRSWVLGTADAGTAEENRLGQVTWSVTLPDAVRPGRAKLLTTPGHQPLEVRIARTG